MESMTAPAVPLKNACASLFIRVYQELPRFNLKVVFSRLNKRQYNEGDKMKKHWLLHILAGLAISSLALWNLMDRASGAAVRSDALHYLAYGYNLARHHVFSRSIKDTAEDAWLTRTCYRTPGFPVFLATCLTLHPKLKKASLAQLTANEVERLSLAYDLTHLVNPGDSLMLEALVKLPSTDRASSPLLLYPLQTRLQLSGSGNGALFINTQPSENDATWTWEGGQTEADFLSGGNSWLLTSLKKINVPKSAKILAGITFRPYATGDSLQIKQFRVTRQSDNTVLIDDDFTVWNGPATVQDEQVSAIGGKLNIMAEKQGDFVLTHGMEDGVAYQEIKFIRPGSTPLLATLKAMQAPIVLVVAWLAFSIVLKLTRRISLSYLALCLILFSFTMQEQMNTLLTELLTGTILLVVAWLLYLITKQSRFWLWIALGVLTTVLAFTQAVTLYLPGIIVILALLLLGKQPKGARLKYLAGVLSFALICALSLGGWMTRNLTGGGNGRF